MVVKKYDDKYMSMAKIWAQNSHAIRNKVGALVVKDNTIISDGYNGMPTGFDNRCETVSCQYDGICGNYPDKDDACLTCKHATLKTKSIVIHAECNALMKLAKGTQSSIGATMYVTLSPCCECAKMIIQSGIKRVVYCEEYRDKKGIELLEQAGILVEQINIEQ